jgi:hypothetical protein
MSDLRSAWVRVGGVLGADNAEDNAWLHVGPHWPCDSVSCNDEP